MPSLASHFNVTIWENAHPNAAFHLRRTLELFRQEPTNFDRVRDYVAKHPLTPKESSEGELFLATINSSSPRPLANNLWKDLMGIIKIWSRVSKKIASPKILKSAAKKSVSANRPIVPVKKVAPPKSAPEARVLAATLEVDLKNLYETILKRTENDSRILRKPFVERVAYFGRHLRRVHELLRVGTLELAEEVGEYVRVQLAVFREQTETLFSTEKMVSQTAATVSEQLLALKRHKQFVVELLDAHTELANIADRLTKGVPAFLEKEFVPAHHYDFRTLLNQYTALFNILDRAREQASIVSTDLTRGHVS